MSFSGRIIGGIERNLARIFLNIDLSKPNFETTKSSYFCRYRKKKCKEKVSGIESGQPLANGTFGKLGNTMDV